MDEERTENPQEHGKEAFKPPTSLWRRRKSNSTETFAVTQSIEAPAAKSPIGPTELSLPGRLGAKRHRPESRLPVGAPVGGHFPCLVMSSELTKGEKAAPARLAEEAGPGRRVAETCSCVPVQNRPENRPQLRTSPKNLNDSGRPTGVEPVTPGATVRCSAS